MLLRGGVNNILTVSVAGPIHSLRRLGSYRYCSPDRVLQTTICRTESVSISVLNSQTGLTASAGISFSAGVYDQNRQKAYGFNRGMNGVNRYQ